MLTCRAREEVLLHADTAVGAQTARLLLSVPPTALSASGLIGPPCLMGDTETAGAIVLLLIRPTHPGFRMRSISDSVLSESVSCALSVQKGDSRGPQILQALASLFSNVHKHSPSKWQFSCLSPMCLYCIWCSCEGK